MRSLSFGHVRDKCRQRLGQDAERRKAIRSRLDFARGVDKGDEMTVFGKAADGATGDLGCTARAGLRRRHRQHDRVFTVRHRHRAGQKADSAAGQAGRQPDRDGAIAGRSAENRWSP